MFWDTNEDSLSIDTDSLMEFLKNKRNTKRFILKTAGKIFDPFGLITPFTVRLKFLLQELWVRKLTWDDELPTDICQEWAKWCCECHHLSKIAVPRFILNPEADSIEIHCFSDASQRAYGTVVYVKLRKQEEISVSFVASKCRVAPVKRITLPRLELLGALLAARLGSGVKKLLDQKKSSRIFYWTDAKIVLCWIKGTSTKWKSFIANRVNEIRKLTQPTEWFYCSTKENPADVMTRGVQIDFLVNCSKWWSCCDFLTCSEIPHQDLSIEVVEENPQVRRYGVLTLEEIKDAEVYILLEAQKSEFREEINQLKRDFPRDHLDKNNFLGYYADNTALTVKSANANHALKKLQDIMPNIESILVY
ncbi:uncharacterized protein LOC118205074 [Stegodyphus dumicola]|uniref:uncharacterized protein LOC118205074 n=1 Tax=Stegodyphus dumicola TaxID=202533 RepID=UPI0015B0076D|nr:uncharacterized protein LOC118205074 [Stegodyphus dumicola]